MSGRIHRVDTVAYKPPVTKHFVKSVWLIEYPIYAGFLQLDERPIRHIMVIRKDVMLVLMIRIMGAVQEKSEKIEIV